MLFIAFKGQVFPFKTNIDGGQINRLIVLIHLLKASDQESAQKRGNVVKYIVNTCYVNVMLISILVPNSVLFFIRFVSTSFESGDVHSV